MSRVAAFVLLFLTVQPALAQDFNQYPPNATSQSPAFEGQTRAPVLPDAIPLNTEILSLIHI